MFKYFLISIVIAPLAIGVAAAIGRDGPSRSLMRVGTTVYAVLWFMALYYLRYRWS